MPHFIEERNFQDKLRDIDGSTGHADDFLSVVEEAIQMSNRLFSFVRIHYRGVTLMVWYVRNGDTVTLLDVASC